MKFDFAADQLAPMRNFVERDMPKLAMTNCDSTSVFPLAIRTVLMAGLPHPGRPTT